MEKQASSPTSDALLAELGWIRSLAGALAGSYPDADDLAQDAWLAAATHPPRDPQALRPWLRRVMANLAALRGRSSSRRARREAETLAPPPEPPADELVARAQLQQALVSMVLALDEPYRSTVLLRHFDGLTAAEIARRQGVPAATVRWRLAHALGLLRGRLDDRTGGDRRAWVVLLLPGTRPASGMMGRAPIQAILPWACLFLIAAAGAGIWWHGRRPSSVALGPPAPRITAPGQLGSQTRRASPPPERLFVQPGAPARRVAGRVLYEERPVEGAVVELADALTDTEAISRQVRRTDDGGWFEFGPQPPTSYEVIATMPGRTPAMLKLELRDPTARPLPDQIVLRLRDCEAPLWGMVSDVSGGPVARARVCHAVAGIPRVCALSDGDGRYELCGERHSAMSLYVGASGYGAVVERVAPRGARLRRDFALVPQAAISGTVVRDADGQPVAGAHVSAAAEYGGRAAPVAALSDERGRFALAGIAPGYYQIAASSGDLASLQPIDVRLDGGQTRQDLVLRLADTATVTGLVTSRGRPVPGVQVETVSQETSAGASPRAISQRDGGFILRGVRRGLNQLRSRAHEVLDPRVINVAKPVVTGLRVEVAPPAILRGRVSRQGRPVPNARVFGGSFETRSDENGDFELAGLPAGAHAIEAVTTQARARAQVRMRAGEITRVNLPLEAAASISGVLLEEGERPAPGLIVTFSQQRGGDDFSMCTSAEDGSFTVARLAGHDTYVARVQADLSAPFKLSPAPGTSFPQVVLRDGESHVRGVRLVIQHDHLTIAGTVVEVAGQPRPDVEVTAVRLDRRGAGVYRPGIVYPRDTSAADGTFSIRGLGPGAFLLYARAGNGAEVQVSGVRSGARGVLLRLPATGAIEGKLIGFRAAPEVIATPVGRSQRQLRAVVSGSSFRLAELAPGAYQVGALSNDADAVTVVVQSGATARAELTARGRATVRGRVLERASRSPVPGLTCSVLLGGEAPDPGLRLPASVITDERGRFELAAPAGNPAIECRGPAGAISNGAAVLSLQAGQEVDIEIPVVRPRIPQPQVGKLIGVVFERSLLGAALASVVPGGPADRAGLHAGDVLIALDGEPVEGLTQHGIVHLIYDRPVGATASMTFARRGHQVRATIEIASPAD